jgi:hypothetical protein
MEFDALTDFTDDEYNAFIDSVMSACVNDLNAARGDDGRGRNAIERYIRRGYTAHLSPSELIDFFCVSAGCVLEAAKLPKEQEDAVMAAFDELNTALGQVYHGSS